MGVTPRLSVHIGSVALPCPGPDRGQLAAAVAVALDSMLGGPDALRTSRPARLVLQGTTLEVDDPSDVGAVAAEIARRIHAALVTGGLAR
jgi:hypothetical protein